MYRLRWQIELAFKRLKSLLNIDRLPARTEKGARSWIYAHLILAIATDNCSQDFLELLLPLRTCLNAKYSPSIWRVQKTVILILRIAIRGHVAIKHLQNAAARFIGSSQSLQENENCRSNTQFAFLILAPMGVPRHKPRLTPRTPLLKRSYAGGRRPDLVG